jgi:DNA-binding NarL/FixJ family response regulator
MTIKVLLADDHQLVREGIKLVLDREEGVRVVGEASTGDAAVEATGRVRPDLVIMDIKMPGMNGILATRRIRPGSSIFSGRCVPPRCVSPHRPESTQGPFR